jgi:sn-glycerol 3-phosphate transport system permease protein
MKHMSVWRTELIPFLLKLILGLLLIMPLAYCVSLSLMTPGEIFSYPPKLFPGSLYLDTYRELLRTIPLFRFLMNSVFLATVSTASKILLDSLAGYAFAFFEFKGKKGLFFVILFAYMVPEESIVVANFSTIAKAGLLDTMAAVLLPNLASAIGVFVMRQRFMSIPKELREVAVIDGCGSLRFFASVALPMAQSSAVSLAMIEFVSSWNMYLWPLLVTNSTENRTIQIGISMLNFSDSQSYGLCAAGIVAALVPPIVLFLLCNRKIVEGLTAGAVKG